MVRLIQAIVALNYNSLRARSNELPSMRKGLGRCNQEGGARKVFLVLRMHPRTVGKRIWWSVVVAPK